MADITNKEKYQSITNDEAPNQPLLRVIESSFNLSAGDKDLQKALSDSGFSVADIYSLNEEAIKALDEEATQQKIPEGAVILVPKAVIAKLNYNKNRKLTEIAEITASGNYRAFVAEQIRAITQSSGYQKIETKISGVGNDYNKEIVKPTVYIYSKRLDEIIDVSPFVINCRTYNGDGGGNWSVNVPSLTAEYSEGILQNRKESLNHYVKGMMYRKGVELRSGQKAENVLNTFFFDVAISPNDIVFVRFEPLKDDVNIDNRIERNKITNKITLEDMEGGLFDMIGLVDQTNITVDHGNGSVVLSISGRDFNKVLLNDGAYFFPASTNSNFRSNYFANITDEETQQKPFKRIFNELQSFQLFSLQTVNKLLSIIFQQFGAIEIVDDEKVNHIQDAPTGSTGIWRYIRLVSEEAAGERSLVDSGIATNSGSMQNFIDRVCQKPFVEFFTDTYGDRFYWIVRRPPFTREAFVTQFESVNDGDGIRIKDSDLIEMDVNMSDKHAYSWYRLTPLGYYVGDTQFANFYFPAVFFPQYAKYFGNQALQEESIYLDYGQSTGSVNYDKAYVQARKDLRYMVETNSYLPFTREGSIRIIGDRRIKRGMVIYIENTDELYHVKGVENSYIVNEGESIRTTNIQVSRGMVASHYARYFELIQYDKIDKQFRLGNNPPITEEQKKINWKVNEENFFFLMNKRQFDK